MAIEKETYHFLIKNLKQILWYYYLMR